MSRLSSNHRLWQIEQFCHISLVNFKRVPFDSGFETGSELFAKIVAHGDFLNSNHRNGHGDVVPDLQLLALGFKVLQNDLKITIIFSAFQDDIPVDNCERTAVSREKGEESPRILLIFGGLL